MYGYFKRAFAVAFTAAVLFIVLVFAFELINRRTEKSGFSSGEFFAADYNEPYLSGEFFGEEFIIDFSPVLKAAFFGKNLLIVVPPFLRFPLLFIFSQFFCFV